MDSLSDPASETNLVHNVPQEVLKADAGGLLLASAAAIGTLWMSERRLMRAQQS